jgi:hypothetical protein
MFECTEGWWYIGLCNGLNIALTLTIFSRCAELEDCSTLKLQEVVFRCTEFDGHIAHKEI